MTDNKRNSTGGKVATPKGLNAPATPPMADPLEALGKAIGARIKLSTTAPHSQSYEGTLYTACPILNLVAINTRPPSATSTGAASLTGDYHIVPVSRIQSFQVMALPNNNTQGGDGSFANAVPAIGTVDTKRLQQRAEERVAKLKEQAQDRGQGVTDEAQDLFDSLKRIGQDVRWHNHDIIVNDTVIITPPYALEDCRGPKAQQAQVNRVKTMLQGERKKLKEREERQKGAVSAPGPRKGG